MHTMRFAESDDVMSFSRNDDVVLIAASYRPGIGIVHSGQLNILVRDFVDEQLAWLSLNYPAALRNPAMADVLDRIT
jgi:hypothetical protein